MTLPSAAVDYHVGPHQALAEIEQVPWESLNAGDTVNIHWRSEPYRSKWVLCRQGTAGNPISVRGISNESGELPVIDGIDAKTRGQLNFWNEDRGVIKIGGANNPPDTMPRHITIENLDIRSGRPPYRFTGRHGETPYRSNAASVYIEKGEHIVVRGCVLRDSGNGLFIGGDVKHAMIDSCYIYDNGIEGSIYEHNTYTTASGLVYQFNRFGKLRTGCLGNNLKDRSAGLVVRYNWIEDGNRQLDLVDSSGHDPSVDYHTTLVYGNVLIEHDGEGNSQIVHYGGDSGSTGRYRKGTLYFYHNTVVSYRGGNTTLFRLSTNDESVECWNNILYVTAPGSRFALINDAGAAVFHRNFIKPNWTVSHSGSISGTVTVMADTIAGENPYFTDIDKKDFFLDDRSLCVDQAIPLPFPALSDHAVRYQYLPHRTFGQRPLDHRLDIGAFETKEVQTLIDSTEWPEKDGN